MSKETYTSMTSVHIKILHCVLLGPICRKYGSLHLFVVGSFCNDEYF